MHAKLTSVRFPISPNFHTKNKSFRGNVRTIKRNVSTEGLSGAFFFGGGKLSAQTRWALSELHHRARVHWRVTGEHMQSQQRAQPSRHIRISAIYFFGLVQ